MSRIAGWCLGCLCIAGSVSGEIKLPEGWQLPSGGYQAIYDADDGVLPTDNSGENKPVFVDSTVAYDTTPPLEAPYAEMTADVTGAKVLRLVNSPTLGPLYRLFRGAGVGTAEDLITLDIRLRCTETVAGSYQLAFFIYRPASEAERAMGTNTVFFLIRMSNAQFIKLGTQWHDLRFHIDVAKKKVDLYLDGGTKPVSGINASIATVSMAKNHIEFGDGGSTGGQGAVNIAYIAWTNKELAPAAKDE